MPDPIAALSRQLDADLLRLQAVAQNVANANTAGYRAARLAVAKGDEAATLRADLRTPGALEPTGGALDLALIGSAFLAVETPQGERYTRAGDLRRLDDGTLATSEGHAVLGTDGPIRLPDEAVTFDASGAVLREGVPVAQLKLVALPDAARAHLAGPGLFAYDGEVAEATGTRVVQGVLERANVDVTDEMVQMMETTRHAESVQRAIAAYEQMLATALEQLGRGR